MTVLALLRHAETPWSADKRLQGRSDIPLSPQGRAWLRERRIPVAWRHLRVVSSPLQRCVQTVECLALSSSVTEPRIAEMSWGSWEGKTLEALRAELGEAMRDNESRGMDFRPAGGESPREVWARVRPWLAEVANAGQGTLAVAHRGVMRVIFAAAMGWDLLGRPPARIDWRCMQVFRLRDDGHPEVLQLNLPLDVAASAPSPSALKA